MFLRNITVIQIIKAVKLLQQVLATLHLKGSTFLLHHVQGVPKKVSSLVVNKRAFIIVWS